MARDVALDLGTLCDTLWATSEDRLTYHLDLKDASADVGPHGVSIYDTLRTPRVLAFLEAYYSVLGLTTSIEFIDSTRTVKVNLAVAEAGHQICPPEQLVRDSASCSTTCSLQSPRRDGNVSDLGCASSL